MSIHFIVRLQTQKESLMTHDIVTPSPPESSLAQHLLVMAFGESSRVGGIPHQSKGCLDEGCATFS